MKFLVYGDLHLKPAGSGYALDKMVIPPDIDAVLILGDLTHRAGEDDIALAEEFVSRFAADLPVIYVPGNHDPAPTEERVVESIKEAYSGHENVHQFDQLSVIGWGCEKRTLYSNLDQTNYKALDPHGVPHEHRRYTANKIADKIEAACYDVICGSKTIGDAVESLEIEPSEEATFHREMAVVETAYRQLAEVLEGTEDVLLATMYHHTIPHSTAITRSDLESSTSNSSTSVPSQSNSRFVRTTCSVRLVATLILTGTMS